MKPDQKDQKSQFGPNYSTKIYKVAGKESMRKEAKRKEGNGNQIGREAQYYIVITIDISINIIVISNTISVTNLYMSRALFLL